MATLKPATNISTGNSERMLLLLLLLLLRGNGCVVGDRSRRAHASSMSTGAAATY